jgi:hypothetical protein
MAHITDSNSNLIPTGGGVYIVLNGRSEKDLEGTGHGIIEVLPQYLPGDNEENHGFKPSTS